MPIRVLVVDDELSVREFFEILLAKEGYEVATAADGLSAVKLIKDQVFDLVITDLQMKNGDGMTLLREAKKVQGDVPVIMITAFATTDSAVDAMKAGAFDYVSKPFKIDEIKMVIRNALKTRSLIEENRTLKSELQSKYDFSNLHGDSEGMRQVLNLIRKSAPTRTNILIFGESGTGKELVARALHFNSPRKDGPIVTVNCGAIPESLIESELFGHERGAFTGATATKHGLFEAANKGTLFLDEIGELPLPMQVKLLRVIQEKNFHRVGGTESIEVDVRIIAATNRTLEEEVKKGRFREDLFYRLNVIQIQIPPLRERRDDIALLADFFLRKYAKETSKDIRRISPEAMNLLLAYDFPGNVRELENIIERSVALEMGQAVQVDSLPSHVVNYEHKKEVFSLKEADQKFQQGTFALDELVDSFEKEWLLKALEKTHGSRSRAAKILGITSRSMRYRLKKHGIGSDDDDDSLLGLDEASEMEAIRMKIASGSISNDKGFTLIEIMITVLILGVLAAIAIPSYQSYVYRSYLNEANAGIAAIKTGQESYFQQFDCYVAADRHPTEAAITAAQGLKVDWDPVPANTAWGQAPMNIRPDRQVRFGYQVFASNAYDAATGCGAVIDRTTIGDIDCVANANLVANIIPSTIFPTHWYVVAAYSDFDGDGTEMTMVSAIDDSTVLTCNDLE